RNVESFVLGCHLQREMQHRLSAGAHRDRLCGLSKTWRNYNHYVLADGDCIEFKLAVVVGASALGPIGRSCAEHHHSTLQRAMLRIMHNPAHGAEDGSESNSGDMH